ncbi:hypothetical protein [Saccharopolyspora sp. ASAGF58]|uniref:hypothetical protein n=1 Tax=Saccharopolyspora sp. ASAGF58 TaxID=2719023 RepID=UPI00143FFC5B|nr:hypothetical protein [Saccharopolyspora sp. ASAGF58]QIZ38692.1 hypothetical protein FDZ84_34500 [Saccharopolyspora sp. ASAGF58]
MAVAVAHRFANDRFGVLRQRRGQGIQGTRHPHDDLHRGITDQFADGLLDAPSEAGEPAGQACKGGGQAPPPGRGHSLRLLSAPAEDIADVLGGSFVNLSILTATRRKLLLCAAY